MSEFKIIKCKNCDAALTEINGQKLSSCIQCGHQFNALSKQKKRNYSSISKEEFKPQSTVATSSEGNSTPDFQGVLRKLKEISNSKTTPQSTTTSTTSSPTTNSSPKTNKTKILPKKKKANPIGTIIFYIILFSVLRSIFKF